MTNQLELRFGGSEILYIAEALMYGLKATPDGTFAERLERSFTERFDVPYGISANSGTSPMHMCLAALGIGPGDEVIVPSLGPMMPTFVVMHAGAMPVFADVDLETFLLDPEDVEKKITVRTKAILLVHLYGAVCDMTAFMRLAEKYSLAIIEDCAQCVLGKDSEGRLAGTIGNAGSFSFDNKKHLSSGEGGMLITRDERLALNVRRFGGLGFGSIAAQTGNVARDLASFQSPDYKRHASFGYNYRMPALAAAVALAQVERVDEIIGLAQLMAKRFLEVIKEEQCDWIVPQRLYPGSESSYWIFAARYEGEARFSVSWHDFRRRFMSHGGDGIYACWQLSFEEPAMQMINEQGTAFEGGPPILAAYRGAFDSVSTPNAKALQPKLLQFTTNQLTLEHRESQAQALRFTIREIEGGK